MEAPSIAHGVSGGEAEGSSDVKRTFLSLAVPADPLTPFPPEAWRQELCVQSIRGIDFPHPIPLSPHEVIQLDALGSRCSLPLHWLLPWTSSSSAS